MAHKVDDGANMFAGEAPKAGYWAKMFVGAPKADYGANKPPDLINYYVGTPKRGGAVGWRVCYGCSLITGPYFSTLIVWFKVLITSSCCMISFSCLVDFSAATFSLPSRNGTQSCSYALFKSYSTLALQILHKSVISSHSSVKCFWIWLCVFNVWFKLHPRGH